MKYFNSDQVKVYPCAYRGTKEDSQLAAAKIYDPDSRLNTEYNITKSGSCGLKGNENRSENSYIISGPENANVTEKLEFVICGYHFDIDYQARDMIDAGGILGNLCINIGRDSKVLLPVTATDDTPATLDQNEKFVGLGIANDNELSNKKFIRIFDAAGNLFISNLFASSFYGGKGLDTDGDKIVAIGNYNDPISGDILEVGCGTDKNNRSNIIRVLNNETIMAETKNTQLTTDELWVNIPLGDGTQRTLIQGYATDKHYGHLEVDAEQLILKNQTSGILQTDNTGKIEAVTELNNLSTVKTDNLAVDQNLDVASALRVGVAAGGVIVPYIKSAPFLKTNSTGKLVKGTDLVVSSVTSSDIKSAPFLKTDKDGKIVKGTSSDSLGNITTGNITAGNITASGSISGNIISKTISSNKIITSSVDTDAITFMTDPSVNISAAKIFGKEVIAKIDASYIAAKKWISISASNALIKEAVFKVQYTIIESPTPQEVRITVRAGQVTGNSSQLAEGQTFSKITDFDLVSVLSTGDYWYKPEKKLTQRSYTAAGITFDTKIIPVDGTHDIGASDHKWGTIYANTTVAENVNTEAINGAQLPTEEGLYGIKVTTTANGPSYEFVKIK